MRNLLALVLSALLVSNAFAWSSGGWAGSDTPGGAAGGDLFGTFPSPGVTDDSHSHGVNSLNSTPRLSGAPIPGAFGIPGVSLASSATVAEITGATYYVPLIVHEPLTLTGAAANVTVAGGGGSTMELAVYNANSVWQPTTRVVNFGSVSIATTGAKSFTGSGALAPGRYLAGYRVSDGATFENVLYHLPDAWMFFPALGHCSQLYAIEAFASPMPSTAAAWVACILGTTPWASIATFTWTVP